MPSPGSSQRTRPLRAALDYTWYIIKSSDVDGMAKNEGWFKGPFTISQYQHNFFRPAFDQQVEWSFPIDYKQYHFNAPTPETQCIMRLIDEVRPVFIYSLHNSGFGGCYWYLTDGEETLYRRLHDVPAKYGIGLNLGEPEMPYCKSLYEAIYEMTGHPRQLRLSGKIHAGQTHAHPAHRGRLQL